VDVSFELPDENLQKALSISVLAIPFTIRTYILFAQNTVQ